MGCNIITSRVPQTWPGVAPYLTEQRWHKWSGWQGWELLSQQINLPLALYNGSKAVWNEGDLLWVWWVWEKVPFGAARSGNQLDAPQDALVAGWSNVHWNGPLAVSARPNTLSQYFSLLSERFFCFQNLFLKYKLNQRKTAFEGCGVVLFLPLRNSGGGCVVEYSSANHQSGSFPVPPSTWRRAKTAAKASLTGSHGFFCSVTLQLGWSLSWGRRSDAVLSLTHRAQNLLPQGTA